MLSEAGVSPRRERLRRDGDGVVKEGNRVLALRCESGAVVRARVFLDCSYEGDLVSLSGTAHAVGREGAAEYGETFAGAAAPGSRMPCP